MSLVVVLDVKECTNGTHRCDVNAVCNSTRGSYNCTCKDGFYGDGINCAGNYLQNAVEELNSGQPRTSPNSYRVENLTRRARFKIQRLRLLGHAALWHAYT